MNRCSRQIATLAIPNVRLWLASALTFLCLMSANGAASAQTPEPREFPKNAIRGQLTVISPPDISIDGVVKRLSPGSRIRGALNELVMSANLVNQTFTVNYVLESNGLVHQVWILTDAEAKVKLASARPSINAFFPSITDSTPKDDGKTPFDKLPKYNGAQP